MARLIAQIGSGVPSFTLDLGDDSNALQEMRETLAGNPSVLPLVDVLPGNDEIPSSADWITAPAAEVVEAYVRQVHSDGRRRRKRGLRLLPESQS